MFHALAVLAITTLALLGSPGPAPIALAAAGATDGIRRSLGFYAGLTVGLATAAAGAALGLAALFAAFPGLKHTLEIVGTVYIVYLAWRIASARVSFDDEAASQAPRFVDGLILNVINPKSYAAFVALFSKFLLPASTSLLAYAGTATVCVGIAICTNAFWLSLGGLLRPVFANPIQARVLRAVLAGAMVIAVFWTLTL